MKLNMPKSFAAIAMTASSIMLCSHEAKARIGEARAANTQRKLAKPTDTPTTFPTNIASSAPSSAPSAQPSVVASRVPSKVPSQAPSNHPTSMPSAAPSTPAPTKSSAPSGTPSSAPSSTLQKRVADLESALTALEEKNDELTTVVESIHALNDAICSAYTLELDGSPVDFDLSTAGTEASEVSGVWYGDDPADNTLWYKVVAPSTGCIDVKVSSIYDADTQLALWSTSAATSCNDFENFELLASHEDFFVMVTWYAHLINVAGLNPGETYYVQLDGYESDNASGTIEATTCGGELAPDNDGVCSPQAIIVDGAPVSYNNTYATADYDEVQGANWTAGYNGIDDDHLPDFDAAQNSLWYTFKAPLNGCVSVIANVSQTEY